MSIITLPAQVIASDLGFIEGPLIHHGAVLLCDLHGGLIRKVADGQQSVLCETGGAPNGLAIGPDGQLYVANNGGAMRWEKDGDRLISKGFKPEGYDARIERIDMATGDASRIVNMIDGRRFEAIDDLVFDGDGGFWFTDLGRDGERNRTYGGIYWTSLDGSEVIEAAFPIVNGANGIGLSHDGRTLYATEYGAGRLWAWSVEGPGQLRKLEGQAHGGRPLWQAPGAQLLDSLKVAPSGNIVIATQPTGLFSVISPEGRYLGAVEVPDSDPTNLCFDPADPSIVYATLGTTGRLMKIHWDEARLGGACDPSMLTGDSQ
jgi:gluconolactonase